MPSPVEIGRALRENAKVLAQTDTRPKRITSSHKPIKLTKREMLFEGFYAFEKLHYQYERFDGEMSRVIARDMLVTGDSAILLPYDPIRDEVVLIEQIRPAALARGNYDAWSLEPIAGYVDHGERPETTAVREAVEEGGLSITDVFEIPSSYQSPGCLSQKMYSFIGKCDLSNFEEGTYGLVSEDEDTRTVKISRAEAIAMVKSGEINITLLQMIVMALEIFNDDIKAKFA